MSTDTIPVHVMDEHDHRDDPTETVLLLKQSSPDTGSANKQSYISPLLKPIILFLLGALFALVHHFVNDYADGRSLNSIVISQTWMSRIGTGLAFGFKSALSVSIGFVLCQLMWLTLRRTFVTCSEIDQVYRTANQDVVATFFSSTILKSPLLVCMVAVSLLLPITSVFVPSSLRVALHDSESPIPCQIPTGNLTNGLRSRIELFVAGGDSYHENWTGLTPAARKLAYPTLFAQNILPVPSPQQCYGLNCMYYVSFPSVEYQCQEGVELPGMSVDVYAPTITFWNATTNSTKSFYAYWSSAAPSGTHGSALCTATKVQYDFMIQIRDGQQTINYNITQIGELDLSGGNPDERFDDFQLQSIAYVIQTLFLGAYVESYSPGGTTTELTSEAVSAAFFNKTLDGYAWGDVPHGIKQLSHNVSAAILTMDLGVKDSSCVLFQQDAVYKYDRLNLWLPYGVALFIVSLCLILGITVFLKLNPENLTTSFSDTVRITKNSSLKILQVDGKSNGVADGKKEPDLPRFRLGELKNGNTGFGTREELTQE